MDPTPAVPVAASTIEVVEVSPVEPELPYWSKGGIAPIKSEYVLWDKMKNGRPGAGTGAAEDDDAAEGRGTTTADRKEDSRPVRAPQATAAAEASDTPAVSTGEGGTTTEGIKNTHERSLSETEAGPEVKKVRLSGAQKKAAARARNEEIWQAKVAAKAAAKAEEKERKIAAGETEFTGGGRQKANGQNKGRTFNNLAGVDRICINTARGEECPKDKEGKCRNSHDLQTFLSTLPPDIPINTPVSVDDLNPVSLQRICPLYLSLGKCSVGFKCRFASTHMKKVGEGEGTLGTDYILLVNEEKVAELEKNRGEGLSEIRERGEMNYITGAEIGRIRGSGIERENRFPLTTAYLTSIGEPIEWEGGAHPNGSGGRGGKGGRGGRGGARGGKYLGKSDRENVATEVVSEVQPEGTEASTSTLPESTPGLYVASDDVDDQPSRSYIPDLAPIRASEKKRLDFRGKLYLAPLTTTGNLPFRRLCGDFGNDISCSEMGLAQEFLNGNASEWSLVRRHPSEKIFGIQVCGSRPQVLVPAAEAIVKSCDIDFLDVNCGCPIDLVFNKGGGSALLGHATKLGKSLVGMSQVLGEIPLTIKIRTGITASTPVAHKLVTKFQTEWGVSHVTLHGRSRQQRYKTKADYNYIAQVAQTLRETAADEGLAPIPIFGNGDAYDYRTYYENMEASGVDGIMIARGALMKPWIFTEIKERRDFDISSRERLDMVGTLAKYGLEHWGSDTMGINTTRRFMCEALSFQYRYVPVGLLERLPADMNERPFPYKGRNELETLLASDSSEDWVKLTSMFLGPPEDNWSFAPKHKSNAHDAVEVQG